MRFPLPNPDDFQGDILGWIKQTELTLHHIRKSYQEMTNGIGEEAQNNLLFCLRHPKIELYKREQDNEGFVKIHVDEEGNQMCDTEIELSWM